MKSDANGPSMTRGIVVCLIGGILIAPFFYRHESINWNSLFTYIFIVIGLFLLTIGVMAIIQARRCSTSNQELPSEPVSEMQRQKPAGLDLIENCVAMEARTTKVKEIHKRSDYYRFAKAVGVLPAIPLAPFILINTSCSLLGFGFGFACTHPGSGTFWLEIFAYFGCYGWLLSLPAWGLLVFAGKLLGVR